MNKIILLKLLHAFVSYVGFVKLFLLPPSDMGLHVTSRGHILSWDVLFALPYVLSTVLTVNIHVLVFPQGVTVLRNFVSKELAKNLGFLEVIRGKTR